MRTTDETAIRDLLQTLYAAWDANDADAFVAPYLDDATVAMPGTFHPDRESIRRYMAAGFAGPLKGSRGRDELRSIRFLGPDAAVAVSRAWIMMAGETELPLDREVTATWVLARRDGQWRIAAYANAPAPA